MAEIGCVGPAGLVAINSWDRRYAMCHLGLSYYLAISEITLSHIASPAITAGPSFGYSDLIHILVRGMRSN
jgi:hypothetical protein